MSSKKAGGATVQHKTRPGKRLGLKKFGNQKVKTGQIIVRQKGTKVKGGPGTKTGRDFTIFAQKDGLVNFIKTKGKTIVKVQ